MIIHVFRLNELIYLVDQRDCERFEINNPDSEYVGIVPYWANDVQDYVRVH